MNKEKEDYGTATSGAHVKQLEAEGKIEEQQDIKKLEETASLPPKDIKPIDYGKLKKDK